VPAYIFLFCYAVYSWLAYEFTLILCEFNLSYSVVEQQKYNEQHALLAYV